MIMMGIGYYYYTIYAAAEKLAAEELAAEELAAAELAAKPYVVTMELAENIHVNGTKRHEIFNTHVFKRAGKITQVRTNGKGHGLCGRPVAIISKAINNIGPGNSLIYGNDNFTKDILYHERLDDLPGSNADYDMVREIDINVEVGDKAHFAFFAGQGCWSKATAGSKIEYTVNPSPPLESFSPTSNINELLNRKWMLYP
jgi:hypothetical protein